MKGWFDAFRNDGGPTLYTYSNRTPVTGDINMISIVLVFSTLLVAFLVIFPGIRKEVSENPAHLTVRYRCHPVLRLVSVNGSNGSCPRDSLLDKGQRVVRVCWKIDTGTSLRCVPPPAPPAIANTGVYQSQMDSCNAFGGTSK